MIDLIVATTNRGKAKEFAELLADDAIRNVIRWTDLATLKPPPEVEETGRTFRANACLKAIAYATHFKRWALADDSGLEVDALGGSPGVHSARWSAMHEAGNGDADNNRLLLRQLDQVEDSKRTARFVCVLALSDPEGRVFFTTRGELHGWILRAPRGANGFGYDPLFFIDSLKQTSAELSAEAKHAISHRGIALREMKKLLPSLG